MTIRMVLHSKILGARLGVVSDDHSSHEAEAGILAYTESEMKILLQQRAPEAALRGVHLVKSAFPGSKVIER